MPPFRVKLKGSDWRVMNPDQSGVMSGSYVRLDAPCDLILHPEIGAGHLWFDGVPAQVGDEIHVVQDNGEPLPACAGPQFRVHLIPGSWRFVTAHKGKAVLTAERVRIEVPCELRIHGEMAGWLWVRGWPRRQADGSITVVADDPR